MNRFTPSITRWPAFSLRTAHPLEIPILRRGIFRSVKELEAAIREYIASPALLNAQVLPNSHDIYCTNH
jgi:hypothetical protein